MIQQFKLCTSTPHKNCADKYNILRKKYVGSLKVLVKRFLIYVDDIQYRIN